MPEFYDFYQRAKDGSPRNETRTLFTDGERDVPHVSDTYKAIPITRSAIVKSGRMGDNEAEITFSIKEEFAKSRIHYHAEDRYWVEIRNRPGRDPFWRGKMKAIRSTRNTIQMTFTALLGALRIYGLPANYQTTCRHSLYDNLCGVSMAGNSRPLDIVTFDSRKLVAQIRERGSPSWPLSQAQFGYLEQDGRNYRITAVSGSLLYLTRITALQKGEATVFRGCDKRFSTCKERFNNLENFGGFPYLSPYEYWGQNLTTLVEQAREE